MVFLTEDRGKKRGVAKNATASRRRFGAALEPLTRGRVDLRGAGAPRSGPRSIGSSRGRRRSRPRTAEPAMTPPGCSGTRRISPSCSTSGRRTGSPNERLFRLGAAVGEALGHGGSVDALARYFEYWLLRLEGVYPALDVCPRCGRRALPDGAVLVDGRSDVCVRRLRARRARGCRATRWRSCRSAAGRDAGGSHRDRRSGDGAAGDRSCAQSADRHAPREGAAIGAGGEGVETRQS